MSQVTRRMQLLWLLAALPLIFLTNAALAADFYAGKKLTVLVGGGAGGGHDIFARMLTRHLVKHIPGAPVIIVQNMPGAGGTRAAEFIYTQGAKDGTFIGTVFPGALVGPLLQEGVKFRYDPLKFAYIGSGDTDTRFCATYHTSKIKTFKDLAQNEGIFGASGAGGSTRDYAYMAANLAGAKIKLVSGYTGTPPIALAMERGEVDGLCGYGWSIFKSERMEWIKQKKLNFLVQMSLSPDPELTAMGVPDFTSLLSGDKRKAAELIIAQQAFSRPYIAPPGAPAAAVTILRTAFDKALVDPALIADFAKINITNKPMKGADVEALVSKLYATPQNIVALARAAQKQPK